MGRAKSQERLELERLLKEDAKQNNGWKNKEDLFYKWQESVNPAKAQRAAKKSYKKERVNQVSAQQLHLIGARHLFTQILGALRSTNRIEERKGPNGLEVRFFDEESTADLDGYSSVIVVDETYDDTLLSVHDPRNNILIISLKRLQDWSDRDLELLASWCNIRVDEGDAFSLTRLMALKVLHSRKAEFERVAK